MIMGVELLRFDMSEYGAPYSFKVDRSSPGMLVMTRRPTYGGHHKAATLRAVA